MSEWKAKRFWKETTVAAVDGGHHILLDGRPVRTPAKAQMVLPTRAMAEAVATEWDAQEGEIDPQVMPVTRSANAAIDKVTKERVAVVEMLAAYGETDLLCHRASHPESLVCKQNEAWNPVLDWAAARYGAPLVTVAGVLPAAQPAASLDAYREALAGYEIFSLTAMHDLIMISGSLLLGLYTVEAQATPEEVWRLSRIDEDWQVAQWGEDEEAAAEASLKREAFFHAARFFALAEGA